MRKVKKQVRTNIGIAELEKMGKEIQSMMDDTDGGVDVQSSDLVLLDSGVPRESSTNGVTSAMVSSRSSRDSCSAGLPPTFATKLVLLSVFLCSTSLLSYHSRVWHFQNGCTIFGKQNTSLIKNGIGSRISQNSGKICDVTDEILQNSGIFIQHN